MGKRSAFPRRKNDAYATPAKAVLPLIPFLVGIRTFAEPCAGDGALVRHLESFGLQCVHSSDIATGKDALTLSSFGDDVTIITNPPFSRRLLLKLITHFMCIAREVWLLLPHDWSTNQYAAEFMVACTDIVPIGRVQWIPGSKYKGGTENFCWYRFVAGHRGPTRHHPRDLPPSFPPHHDRACIQCGETYRPRRSDSKFCSDICRQRAHRGRLAVTAVPAGR
jgi:hypothetical protein